MPTGTVISDPKSNFSSNSNLRIVPIILFMTSPMAPHLQVERDVVEGSILIRQAAIVIKNMVSAKEEDFLGVVDVNSHREP